MAPAKQASLTPFIKIVNTQSSKTTTPTSTPNLEPEPFKWHVLFKSLMNSFLVINNSHHSQLPLIFFFYYFFSSGGCARAFHGQ